MNIIKIFKNNFLFNKKFYRSYIRGYNTLKMEGKLDLIKKLKKDLTIKKVNFKTKNFDKYLFLGSNSFDKEIVIRQLLLARLLNLNFNKKILSFFGNKKNKVIYPLPIDWLKLISEKDIKVNIFISVLYWKFICFQYILKSFQYYLKILLGTLINPINKIIFSRESIYLENIPNQMIKNDFQNNSFYVWIRNHLKNKISRNFYIFINNYESIRSFDNKYKKYFFLLDPFSKLSSRYKIIHFSIWYIKFLILSLIDLIFFEGYRAFILSESMKSKIYQSNKYSISFKYLFFHNSNWIYRPLWTYIAEKNGAENILYFYSSNIVEFSESKKIEDIFNYGWKSCTWSKYYAWDKYMANFLNISIKKPKIFISGIIPFYNSNEIKLNYSQKKGKVISLFDVQPVRDIFYKSIVLSYSYYTPEICIKFLDDILEICKSKNITILYKGKRNIGSNLHPKYRYFIEKIRHKFFFNISPETSVESIMKVSNGVISMAFTSPSTIAKSMNIRSCFYEPTGKIYYKDIQNHNVQTFNNKVSLENWIDSI